MFIHMRKLFIFILSFIFMCIMFLSSAEAKQSEPIILDEFTEMKDMYPGIDMIKDRTRELTIEDIVLEEYSSKFIQSEIIEQKKGFFETANWLRFEVVNQSDSDEWLLEFAFPLINELEVFTIEDGEIISLYKGGSDFSFHNREIKHRHFVLNLEVEPHHSKTFYALAVGSGDLHPPISIWKKDSFIEKTEKEFMLLGIFYGIILVMISYNLFLYFSLRLKSYLYYVLAISCTLLGKVSINGVGFQYLWPNLPRWNLVSAPFWVALGCIFILIFTMVFLNVERYLPSFRKMLYILVPLNAFVIICLPFARYLSLTMMVIASFSTFLTVLTVAIICLIRGARQARFYIVGWVVFLTGVSITILERAVILPFSLITEYAGQATLTLEVVLLSLALADKINLMRKEKEEAERTAKENQELALKNLRKSDELKDEFLAITSHELRTPLYGMIGIAESLRDGITEDISEEAKKHLSMIITSGHRLTYLIDEILDFSKLKYDSLHLQVKPVYINGIVNIVVAMSRTLLKYKPVHLINKVDSSLPPVRADEHRLQQILYNLIDNAIKYTDEGEITISAFVENGKVTIQITDTGKGIPEDELTTIFKPFQQGELSLARHVDGVGIGLSVTKSLVDLHEGDLEVNSAVGKGSTFSIRLPLYIDMEDPIEEAVTTTDIIFNEELELLHTAPQITRNKRTVLIADDEVVNLQVLMNHLSLNGYNVLTAIQGEEILQIVEEKDIDLLILDIMMPGMSGYEVAKRLRETYSLMELPILMLTAKSQLKDKMISFEAGANDYLVKPCDKQELLSRVKTLVEAKILNQTLIEANVYLEERIQERTEDLNVANKNLQLVNDELLAMAASRRQLLENIAHELGTPITLVNHYVQSLQKGLITIDDPRYGKFVADNINILNRLIDDLYDLSKLEEGKMSLNLVEMCLLTWMEKVYNKCEFTVEQEGRYFEREMIPLDFKQFFVTVDIDRMDQLFLNLISNAIKNTPTGTGKIRIEAELLDSDHLMIKTVDNGIGISESDLPFVFGRFYKKVSTKEEQGGTGLGLAIVKEIIQGHNGEIQVESKENEGTTIYVLLPITAK